MIVVQKDGATLAWTAEAVVDKRPSGVVLVAARRFRLTQEATIAHVGGLHLLELFKGAIAHEVETETPLGIGNVVHARFMLHDTGEPEIRGVCFAMFPPGVVPPRLGVLVSDAAALIRLHGFEA